MSNLEKVFDLSNLRRAYKWIMSNPDAQYKSFFRDSYDAFAISSDTNLKWIRNEGLKDRYDFSHASKLLIPKPSGILRPITLLTVDDQTVYQACVNLIADALKKKTSKRYEKRVFAHLYAGKSSQFFYKKWQNSYRKFGKSLRAAHANGYKHIADFDLTSFYDSIDHHVLSHFLRELNIDHDTVEFLMEALKRWTSSTWSLGPANIYHGYGIPQRPLSSGMLSEAVLDHLDQAGEQGTKTIYLRYVDDIKILAKTEEELRRKLIKLDICSKEIGLFPQTSKINIRKVANINEEIKSVSVPPEISLKPFVDQSKLTKRLLELSRGATVSPKDTTRFKYLLAKADGTYRLNTRIMAILKNHPELYVAICSYIHKYTNIPGRLAREIADYICEGPELYHAVSGALLSAALGKVPDASRERIAAFAANRIVRPRKGSIPPQPTYKEALVAWGLTTRSLKFAEFESILLGEADWWVQKRMVRALEPKLFGAPTYAELTNRLLRINNGDVSRIAASRLLQDSVRLSSPYGDVHITAKQVLKSAGAIKSAGQPPTRISQILSYILHRKPTDYDWKILFGKDHRHAELMMIFIKRNFESNMDSFLVQLDSYCDYLVERIWWRLKPGKNYPNYGHAIKDSVLSAALPHAMAAFLKLHGLRLQSTTAHPRIKSGGSTRRLKHKDFWSVRAELVNGFDDLEANFLP
jgi:hypothetical protein